MTPEARRVQQIESRLDNLAIIASDLKTSVALLQQSNDRIEKTVDRAGAERGKIASELGAYGIQLTKFTAAVDAVNTAILELKSQFAELRALPGRVANLEADMAEVRPKVEAHDDHLQQARGAVIAGRLFWLAVGAFATGAAWLYSQFHNIIQNIPTLPRK